MIIRTLSRWLMSIALAALALVAINLLVTTAPTQARHASLINCSGTIQVCIDTANDGDTILIAAGRYTESLTLSKPVSLTGENRDTTIIHAIEGQRVLTVTGATISNSVVISGLTFTGGESDLGGGISIGNDAQPILASIAVVSNSANYGGGILAPTLILRDSLVGNNSGGGVVASLASVSGSQFASNTLFSALGAETLFLTGTQFLNNTADEGGGIYVSQSAHITDARFENNHCTGDYCGGGGIYVSPYFSGSLVLKSATFINNSAYDGGAVSSDKSVLIEDSSFLSNTAINHGGGLYVSWGSSFVVVTNTRFMTNTANNSSGYGGGGGLSAQGIAVTITNSYFGNNAALATNSYGGGADAGLLMLLNTQFISNTAANSGGAFHATTASVTGCYFERNSANVSSGAVLAGDLLNLFNSAFVENRCLNPNCEGGALSIWNTASSSVVSNAVFMSNTALGRGGALVLWQAQPVVVYNSRFLNNVAQTEGSAIFQTYQKGLYLINNLIAGNITASPTGAVIALRSSGESEIEHTTIVASAFAPNPSIAVMSGTLGITNTIIANHAIGISNTGDIVHEDYNLFFGNITNTAGVTSGGHSLVGDPKFVDPLNGDYHLQFGSAAIDHGVEAGVYVDLDGNPRPVGAGFDIGAYEYQLIKVMYLPVIFRQ